MVLVLGIVKASLQIWGIGFGVKRVVLLRSDMDGRRFNLRQKRLNPQTPLCQDRTPVSPVSHNNKEQKILATLILPFNCYILGSAINRP